ncbi:hypothetical protein HYU14_05320 [Candidatus Woesearchaeota archaeon]|nr:hypothetical protein [Candidatus Woesearchaeota archaeon]
MKQDGTFEDIREEVGHYLKHGFLGDAAIAANQGGLEKEAEDIGKKAIAEHLRPEVLSIPRVRYAASLAEQLGWKEETVSIYERQEFFYPAGKLARRFGMMEIAKNHYREAIRRELKLKDFNLSYAMLKDSGLLESEMGSVREIISGLLSEGMGKGPEAAKKSISDASAIAKETGLEAFLSEAAEKIGIALPAIGAQCSLKKARVYGGVAE